jgi:hypothetical protein
MMQSLFIIHPFQLPAGWKFSGPHIRCIAWNNIYKARLSMLILSKTYPVSVLDWQTYQGGTRGSRLCGEDRDRGSENSKVCARTRDTRVIQVRVAKVAYPTSCLGDQVWRPALGVVPRRDWGVLLGTRPSFI